MQRQMEEEDNYPPGGIIRDGVLFPKETVIDFLSDIGVRFFPKFDFCFNTKK